MPIQLRKYQQECVEAVLAMWGEKPWHKEGDDIYRSVVANLATSSGKTLIAGAIIKAVRERGNCLYLADTDELVAQPVKKFHQFFRMAAAIEKAGQSASLMMDVVIGSAQTLQRTERLKRYDPDHFSYIFVDEAHRGSDRNKLITDYFASAKVMGMTATAFRAKLADLSDYYDSVAFELGVFDLIDEGFSPPLKVLTLPVNVDLRQVHQTMSSDGMDYDKNELSTTIAPYYQEIARLIKEHAANRQILAFLPLIKSSQDFVQVCRDNGIEAEHIDGSSPNRENLLRTFEEGRFQLLSCSSLLSTGYDCPRVDTLLNLTPTRSAGLWRQKVGRIVRVLPGVVDGVEDKDERRAAIAASAKPDSLILDLLYQTDRFGLMGPSDLIAGNEDEKKALQTAIAGLTSAQDLQAVSAKVQEEREEKLKQALIDAAKRRSEANDAINLIAAMLHSRKVTNYEPVMKWEHAAVTDKQRDWLRKQGIDPESGKDRGHVSAFMNLIFWRKRAGLCSHKAVEALEKAGITGALSFTAQDAYKILGGEYPCSFGKHSGRPLEAIAVSYWQWCVDQNWFKFSYPVEHDWARRRINSGIRDPRTVCACIGTYVAPNCPVHPRTASEMVRQISEKITQRGD